MKKRRVYHKLLHILSVSALMLFSMSIFFMPIHASYEVYQAMTPASTTQILIQDFLVLDANAYVPNVKITFSINYLTSDKINDSSIYATKDTGLSDCPVRGYPSIKYAVFTPDQVTYSDNQETIVGIGDNTQSITDNVSLSAEQKYAKSDVIVDFSKVKFYEPGIYRYIVSETNISDDSIIEEYEAERYLDIYVTANDDSEALNVSGYLLKEKTDAGIVKIAGFINTYTSYDLTVKNTVSGNQSRDDQYFNYVIKLVGRIAGEQYDITTISTYSNPSANSTKITVKSDGTASGIVWLKAGETFTVYGIPANTVYYTYVDEATLKETGYTSELTYISTAISRAKAMAKSITVTADSDPTLSHTLIATTNMIINNDKAGVIPTGIIVRVAPYASVCLIGFIGIAIFAFKRRNKEDQ